MRNKFSALIVCLLIGVGVVGLTGQAYAQTGGGGQTLWKLQGLLISPVQRIGSSRFRRSGVLARAACMWTTPAR
jgi:hypothetical protein